MGEMARASDHQVSLPTIATHFLKKTIDIPTTNVLICHNNTID